MKKKLLLSIDAHIINAIKQYCFLEKMSVSKGVTLIVQDFMRRNLDTIEERLSESRKAIRKVVNKKSTFRF